MFARYYLILPMPVGSAEAALLDGVEEWMPALAQGASQRAQDLLLDVGVTVAGRRLAKRVQISLGEPRRRGALLVLPLSWRATGSGAIFPTLDGDLELASLGATRTQLALSASYEPPLGILGRTVDRAFLHRLAEATLKDFLDQVGALLNTSVVRPSQFEEVQTAQSERRLRVIPLAGLPGSRLEAVLRAADQCTVHNSIRRSAGGALRPGPARGPRGRPTR